MNRRDYSRLKLGILEQNFNLKLSQLIFTTDQIVFLFIYDFYYEYLLWPFQSLPFHISLARGQFSVQHSRVFSQHWALRAHGL